MFSLRNLTMIALGLCFALELAAQTTPTMSQLPWWDYRPERIDNDFESIIGLSGTTLIAGTNTRYYYTYTPNTFFNMPFAFNFMRTNYPNGHRLSLSYSGRIGFATYGDAGNLYYLAMLYPYPSSQTYYREMDKNLLPYWTDLQTYNVSSPGGGIYWRVDGTSPNRVLTFEWRVAGGIYPSGNVGNFQAKLFEATSTIEYHYGENSIDRTVPSTNPQYTIGYGALIGIRHHGQTQITRELTPQDFNNDEDLFLLFLHPDQVVRDMQPGEDTIAITRMNTQNMYGSSPYTPVWYAYYPSYESNVYQYYKASPYWTYSFPEEDGQPIGYRMRPILNDVVCDSVWFTPQSAINAYVANSAVTVNATFSNQASAIKNNVPVQFQVRYGSAKILVHTSEQRTVSPGSRLGTDDVTFTAVPGSTNNRNGIYEVKVYSQDPNEEDTKNDTCKVSYFILGQHDVLAYSILQPFENVAPLFTKYPVGFGVPIEARFLNVGVNAETNVPVGYEIYRAGESTPIFSGTTVIPGNFSSASYRDYLLPQWTPQQPGTYCMKVYSDLSTDEDHTNDTVPALGQYCFTAAYEIELAASPDEVSPRCFERYPVGQPIRVTGTFRNDGITDATNTPATATIIDPAGNQIYNETVTIQEVVADGGQALAEFPDFIPAQTSGPGTYRLTISATNTQDPIGGNNSYTCTFRVLPQLSGDILVGFGERFQTIEEARDSLFYLGVSGNTNLILIDDEYTVAPVNNDEANPALDFRGRIVGAGENARITWRPHPSKTMVTVNLQSPSGVGIMFGQQVDNNPNGYMVFDGGADRKLRFTLENTGTRDLYVPFYFGRGASNYTVRNVEIMPYGGGDFHCTQTVSIPTYDRTFNQFRWVEGLDQKISAGIMLRNTMPEVISGGQIRPDTLVNEGNLFENNEIHGFGYGIASVGAGPIFRTQSSRFEAVTNRTNTYRDNEIHNVSRAGIVLAYESGSDIVGNRIWDVENDCSTPSTESKGVTGSSTNEPHAAGIWVTSGGNATNNRAFSNNLEIERNLVSEISTTNGNAAGIWVETGREILITPSNVVQSLPTGGSNIEVQNNMAWSYEGSAMSAGIAFSLPGGNTGVNADYRPMGDRVQNNTVYNPANWGTDNFGIVADLGATTVQNNIVAVLNQNAIALVYRTRTPQYEPMNISQVSDYNLIWVPQGSVGMLQRYSPEGYALPSPPVATTLQQWQYLTGLDMNSVSGNIVPEFISTTPGAEDLHLNAQQTNTLAGNRGMTIAGLVDDVDGDPRGQAAINGRYDIGADEFWGVVRNNDLVAENVIGPNGYRATTGRFSDAEYVMSDSLVEVTSRIRNVGGLPRTNVLVTTQVSYWSGSSWVPVTTLSKSANIDAGEASDVAMGTFMPSTLAELGMSDPEFGTMSTNVTPIYRFTVIMGDDDNFTNNRFEKQVRFYVQRSTTESMVTVEHYRPGVAANAIVGQVNLGNKLNADSIMAGLTAIRWDRSGTVGGSNSGFSYDVFERDNWPQHALNFAPWGMLMWMQGDEAEGLLPEERWAIKAQQEAYDEWRRAGLFITGQEVARIHDVTLDAGNGTRADREFVEHYLRADYRGNTNPALYDNRRVQGVRITPGRFEVVASTGVAGDLGPYPSVLRATGGEGVAQGTHWYVEHTGADSLAGMTAAELDRATVFYAIDIRHWGRFAPDADRSGVQRVVLGAIDFLDQYGTVLPVELLSFEATQTGRETVSLTWETGAEIDVAKMVIERAEVIGGVAGEEFTGTSRIGERIAEGSATSGSTYDLIDATVRGGAVYEYRLVSVELDGTEEIVSRRRVEIRGGAGSALDLVVLPNVVTETGVISWRVPRGVEGVVEIIDNRGVVVQSQVVSGNGSGDLSITAGDLPSGNYVVVLRAGEEVLESRMQIRK